MSLSIEAKLVRVWSLVYSKLAYFDAFDFMAAIPAGAADVAELALERGVCACIIPFALHIADLAFGTLELAVAR